MRLVALAIVVVGCAHRPAERLDPQEALRRLIDALDARDFDAVLRVLAEPLRTSLEQALSDRLEKLRTSVKKGGIEASGDHARIRYDSRYHIDLIQENGRWRVRDFN